VHQKKLGRPLADALRLKTMRSESIADAHKPLVVNPVAEF
jgi:hypothetical protein